MRRSVAGSAFLLAFALAFPAVAQQAADQTPAVRVTIHSSQAGRERFGYVAVMEGYVDGTPAALKCELCPALPPGQYQARWEKDKLRIRWREAFGNRKVHEDRYEVNLREPKRDTAWSRSAPVLITAYGVTEQQCMGPIQLANNVIAKIEHPANWRIAIACTAESWEKASLEFHVLGGSRIAFTMWDSPAIPGGGTVLTVLNSEQFDRCMRPGCYVHTILHELGHFRYVTGDETFVEGFAAEQEAALYREHPKTDFPSSDDVVKCLSSRDAPACPITGEIGQLVEAARKTLRLRAAGTQPTERISSDFDGATALPSAANPQLTNADVISMVAFGLSADVILAKVNASRSRLDTSPSGLLQLKAGGVPDALVLEIIKRGTR